LEEYSKEIILKHQYFKFAMVSFANSSPVYELEQTKQNEPMNNISLFS